MTEEKVLIVCGVRFGRKQFVRRAEFQEEIEPRRLDIVDLKFWFKTPSNSS
jgi:hypothetical protein